VFVSDSRDDAEWMQAFRVMPTPVLEAAGYELWVDSDIRVGEEWGQHRGSFRRICAGQR
jgi:hypothetical protein